MISRLFHNNGYFVATGYGNSYFGLQGPFVDHFHPTDPDITSSMVCHFKIRTVVKLFGFCDAGAIYERMRGKTNRWESDLLDIIRELQNEKRPVFSFHHTFVAGHTGHIVGNYVTGNSDQFKMFVSTYTDKLKSVEDVMKKVLDIVDASGRSAIIIVIGDHGVWLSRTTSDLSSPFAVQDRYGIYGAVIRMKSDCDEDKLRSFTPNYATPSRILAGVVKCLAREPSRVDAAVEFHEDHNFSRYGYE